MYSTFKHGEAAYLKLKGYTYYPVVIVRRDGRIEVEFKFEEDLKPIAEQWEAGEVMVNAKRYFIEVKNAWKTVKRLVNDTLSSDLEVNGNK